ncbi:hypothetical protein HYY74_04660 [Candidatus Woesearchaeota archaeon]|nr:hypothetical protein [Candidatus Woesearchaeota archaeon]
MLQLVYTPKWFYGEDIVIDIVSIIVLLVIAGFSLRYYFLSRKRNNLWLGLAFILMAAGLASKVLMNFSFYYKMEFIQTLGELTLTYQVTNVSDNLFYTGYFLMRLLTLLGLFTLYAIYHRQSWQNILLISALIITGTVYTQSAYYVFHILSMLLLLLITLKFAGNCLKNPCTTTGLLAASFSIITISEIPFSLVALHPNFYVAGESAQLVGYLLLLVAFVTILKHGKKKNKD